MRIDGAITLANPYLRAGLLGHEGDIRQAAYDATRARRGAFAAAGITGCIGLGIVQVLTAPVWGAVFRLGG